MGQMPTLVTDFAALVQVILIDLALAGDNAIAVALAAAALPRAQQKLVIFWGIVAALLLRIGFALITVQLLQIQGILLAGGILLLWVAWRMWRDLNAHVPHAHAHPAAQARFWRALVSIVIADVSMSLDNVLAVAGVAREVPAIMVFGLVFSVVLMAVAASFTARLIEKHRWLALLGVLIIVGAAVQMIWEDLAHFFPNRIPTLKQLFGFGEEETAH